MGARNSLGGMLYMLYAGPLFSFLVLYCKYVLPLLTQVALGVQRALKRVLVELPMLPGVYCLLFFYHSFFTACRQKEPCDKTRKGPPCWSRHTVRRGVRTR